jgi:hypothetical protein
LNSYVKEHHFIKVHFLKNVFLNPLNTKFYVFLITEQKSI